MDERVTEPVTLEEGDSYVLATGKTNTDAIVRLGVVEDKIKSGEIMHPDYSQGDTVYFIFKQTLVLAGVIESIFSEYDATSTKHIYHMLLRNTFYGIVIDILSSAFGTIWFGTEAAANTALAALNP